MSAGCEISWRETIAEVIELPADPEGALDLEAMRVAHRSGRPLFGSFSAASNVTGALTDTRAVARLLHEYGALAFFDFAAAAPHAEIDMRIGARDGYDAVFISAHKLVGGPGSPGILAFNPALYGLRAPSSAGGGTVRYVTAQGHDFVGDIEQRESAGTPGIIQIVRAALAFSVKRSIGVAAIERLEGAMIRVAIARLRRHPRVAILGNLAVPRLAILSFLIRTSSGRDLHPGLVVRLLNDLFGIQSRGGCACAGPYGHRLLNMSGPEIDANRDAVLGGFTIVKPGWTRLNFSYFTDARELEFLLAAIEFIADHGERFVADYECNWREGTWRHRRDSAPVGLSSLGLPARSSSDSRSNWRRDCLEQAHRLLADLSVDRSRDGPPAALPLRQVSFQY